MMRKGLRFLFLLVVALVFIPGKAYAWDFLPDGQMWAGDVDGNHCATVHAGEIYDAATYAVGSDPNKISASVRVKLSDPNYGGRFYQYAQTFEKMESWDDYPEWLPAYVGLAQLIGNGLAGDFNIYNSEASVSLFEGAMIDFRRVLSGENLGGSDGSISMWSAVDGSSFDATNPDGYPAGNTTALAGTFENGTVVVGSGTRIFSPYLRSPYYVSDIRLYVSPAAANLANDYISRGYEVCFARWGLNNTNYVGFVAGHDLRLSYDSYGNGLSERRFVIHSSGAGYWVSWGNASGAYFDSDGIFVVIPNNSSYTTSSFTSNTFTYYSPIISTPTVSPPAGDWPESETPVTPEPPEVPAPTAPMVTPDPTPTEPTVVWPIAPIVVNPPEVTVEVTPTGLDYTELLTRINDNLNSIDSYAQAINSGLNSLRPDIIGGFDDVVSAIRNIYTYLQHLDSILERHCKHLRDALDDGIYNLELYIKSLFQWLPEQLNYDAEFTYDDSAVTTLLRRILNKIPGGSSDIPVSYEPNPQADEPGFFEWLLDLWHRFLIDLVSVLPDELGALVDAFSQLTHYFPFSIPWDLFALLSLFEHEPVTPVFDVPWGFGGDEGEIQMVRVDLSAWDGVMEMVRPVFLVGFCWQLAMITKDLLANFDINKGGV